MLYKTIYYLVLEILSDMFDKNVRKSTFWNCLPYSIPSDNILLWIIPTEFTLVLVQWKSRLGTFLIRYHDKTSLNLNMDLRSSSDGSMAYEWFSYHTEYDI